MHFPSREHGSRVARGPNYLSFFRKWVGFEFSARNSVCPRSSLFVQVDYFRIGGYSPAIARMAFSTVPKIFRWVHWLFMKTYFLRFIVSSSEFSNLSQISNPIEEVSKQVSLGNWAIRHPYDPFPQWLELLGESNRVRVPLQAHDCLGPHIQHVGLGQFLCDSNPILQNLNMIRALHP